MVEPTPASADNQPSPATTGGWIVWRQDDNGNRFEVARRESRGEAEDLAATLEARGHRQTYWVSAAG